MNDSPTAESLPSSIELALQRTQMASERTLMAWVRTSVSLISFGFSIYKFFDSFSKEAASSTSFIDPRRFAIIMISIGLLALIAAVAEHVYQGRVLHAAGVKRFSLATALAALVAVLGMLALVAVILHE